jgi:hypothetical protein
MVKDLMNNHLREGMTRSEVVELMGDDVDVLYILMSRNDPDDPDKVSMRAAIRRYDQSVTGRDFCMSYRVVEPGGELPLRGRDLIIEFSKDEIVTGFHLQELSQLNLLMEKLPFPGVTGLEAADDSNTVGGGDDNPQND